MHPREVIGIKNDCKSDAVVHAYNLSYSGVRDQENYG
jgi:hypothetical protein